MDQVDADEQIYTDYKDDKHTQVTNIKFKTTPDRIDAWITAHKEHFPEPDLWDHKPSCATLRIKDSEHGNLTVKFHKTTGVVLIQGAMHKYWKDQYYIKLQRRVSQLRLSPGNADSHNETVLPYVAETDVKVLVEPRASQGDDDEDDGSVHVLDDGDVSDEEHCSNPNGTSTDSQLKIIEESYIRFCDSVVSELSNVRHLINNIDDEIKRLPMKLSDRIKRDIERLKISNEDYDATSAENVYLKSRVSSLIQDTQSQTREIWELKHEVADLKMIISATNRNDTPHDGNTNRATSGSDEGSMPERTIDDGMQPTSPAGRTSALAGESPASAETSTTVTRRGPPPQAAIRVGTESPSLSAQGDTPPPSGHVNTTSPPPPSQGDNPQPPGHADPASPLPSAQGDTPPPSDHADPASPPPSDQDGSRREREGPRPHGRTRDAAMSDESESSDIDTDNNGYNIVTNKRADKLDQMKQQAQHIVFGDSTTKYIDKNRYMGRSPCFLQRTSTTSMAYDTTKGWRKNENVQSAVLHVGVNDVREGKDTNTIGYNVVKCLQNMADCFPNAKLAFSEILLIGRENHHSKSNETVRAVNEHVRDFCEENDFMYISHGKLQSPHAVGLFDDDVHVNNQGGTAVLVSDIQRALRNRQHKATNPNTTGRVFYNRKIKHSVDRRPRYHNSGAVMSDQQDIDMSSILKLLTISMLNNLGVNQ